MKKPILHRPHQYSKLTLNGIDRKCNTATSIRQAHASRPGPLISSTVFSKYTKRGDAVEDIPVPPANIMPPDSVDVSASTSQANDPDVDDILLMIVENNCNANAAPPIIPLAPLYSENHGFTRKYFPGQVILAYSPESMFWPARIKEVYDDRVKMSFYPVLDNHLQLTLWNTQAESWDFKVKDILTFKGVGINEYMGYYSVKSFASTVIVKDDDNDRTKRYEWQHRGSPHVHGILYLSDAPAINVDDMNDEQILMIRSYFDKLCCAINPPFELEPTHHHT
ncbi:unnamed protein product [Trichogramma brassicae]|uniref:Helitron helicase-like domain-containing protein n=1 Tax=Trichogramma brassicae TaxID=86971 RepID=A0A6H5J3G5_9HYME|nr:unnamed protein product [Trichogramma brassicae]